MSIGNFAEVLSQRILVGIILVGRLGVTKSIRAVSSGRSRALDEGRHRAEVGHRLGLDLRAGAGRAPAAEFHEAQKCPSGEVPLVFVKLRLCLSQTI